MVDVTELLVHWYAGRSQAEIADSLRLDRKTVRKYTRPAIEAGFVPGGPPVGEQVWAARAREWFPQLTDARLRASSWPLIAVHHERIADWLGAEVTLATIHQRLRDEHGLQVSESSLRRYVAGNLAAEAARASVTVLRDDPPPGQETLCGTPHNVSYAARENMRRTPRARRGGRGAGASGELIEST